MLRITLVCLCLMSLSTSNHVLGQQSKVQNQKTWTYTYIKAKENRKEDLRSFIELNWFVMDSITVEQGIFNDYQLYENVSTSDSTSWDYIVAVEYFSRGTYDDIKHKWLPIRNEHKVVQINGNDFGELGKVIKSEQLIKTLYK